MFAKVSAAQSITRPPGMKAKPARYFM